MTLARVVAILGAMALSACTAIERAALPAPVEAPGPWRTHAPGSDAAVDHTAWDRFLTTYLVEGQDGVNRVRYGAVTPEDRTRLDTYLAELQAANLATLDRPEQLAFWINLYNAKTVDLVLEAYPVGSIRWVRAGLLPTGPWNSTVLTVSGHPLSLNDVEHRIIRPVWQDPRIHYALNCAAIGCPNLVPVAYTGTNVDALMETNARAYVNDRRGFDLQDGQLTASKIYAWFVEDFGGDEAGVLTHAALYAGPGLAERLKARGQIDGYAYDWRLNDVQQLAE